MGVTYADAVVVGAGPGGATAGAWLAEAGRDVVVLEKEAFPREKVCGDGLTPRAVRELYELGLVDEAEGRAPGWSRSDGLRVHGGGVVLELPWPELHDWPSHSLTCTRMDLDALLARHAVERGAVLWERTEATAPIQREDGRVTGVHWRREDGTEGDVLAPVVIASDGVSSRLATALGVTRREDRPLGVAVRTYYRSPMWDDAWLSSFLELREDDELLPGYGWIFPMADGTVNVGCGLLNTSARFRGINYRELMARWAGAIPDRWELASENQTGSVLSAALPMGFSRVPHHVDGMLLVGDAGGMVNPMNGEGISYAMESARLAAEIVDRALDLRRTDVLDAYGAELQRRWGGYYTLGRWFVQLIAHPEILRVCTTYGMRQERLMRFVLKLMAHLTDEEPSDVTDAVINAASRAAPAA